MVGSSFCSTLQLVTREAEDLPVLDRIVSTAVNRYDVIVHKSILSAFALSWTLLSAACATPPTIPFAYREFRARSEIRSIPPANDGTPVFPPIGMLLANRFTVSEMMSRNEPGDTL
jgi:hypothetical protein